MADRDRVADHSALAAGRAAEVKAKAVKAANERIRYSARLAGGAPPAAAASAAAAAAGGGGGTSAAAGSVVATGRIDDNAEAAGAAEGQTPSLTAPLVRT